MWGVVCLYNSRDRFERCIFIENESGAEGAVFHIETGRHVVIDHCTIVANRDASDEGGVFWVLASRPPVVRNTIVAFNEAAAVVASGVPKFGYCDLYGNSGGDWEGLIADQGVMAGNLAADPRFEDLVRRDVGLRAESPCIDAGDPRFPADRDPDGTRTDMGAITFLRRVDDPGMLARRSPRRASRGTSPGNAAPSLRVVPLAQGEGIRFEFELIGGPAGHLVIFDILGRAVARYQVAGNGTRGNVLSWRGEDAAGLRLSDGIYFCRLETPRGQASGRFLLKR